MDDPSREDGRLARFVLDSGAVLAGRLDRLGRPIEPNPALRRLLESRQSETVEALVRSEDRAAWRTALEQVGRAGAAVEVSVSIDLTPGDLLPIRVRLEPGGEAEVRFLAVPAADVFEAIRRLSLALRTARRGLPRRGRIDPLTGLGDRARADFWLGRAVARAHRTGQPLGCLMVDLDRFKAVNDALGHLEGDRRLRAAARVLASLWPPALAARFGGDEFLVLWPGLDADSAVDAAEGVRSALNRALSESTASIGAACLRADDEPAFLLHRADAALVRAKQKGRNRVEFEG